MAKSNLSLSYPRMSNDMQLAVAIDGLAEHFVLFDEEDRIVLANKAWKELNKEIIDFTVPGTRFEDHLREAIKRGLVPEAQGREEEWLRERMERHYNPQGPFQMERQDGTWLLLHEQRLPNNAIVLIISDITEQKRVEEELRDSDERFQAFIKNSPAKMHIKDPQGRYILINPMTESIFGVTHEQAKGRSATEIFPEKMGETFDSHDKAVLRTGVASTVEEDFPTSEGSRTFLTVKFPIRNAGGEVAAIGSSGMEITERKRAEADLKIAAIALDSHEAIAITDGDQKIVKVNQAFTNITGYSAAEALGQKPGQLLRSGHQDEQFYQAMWDSLNKNKYWQGEIWNRHKDGEVYPHRLNITAVTAEDDQVTHYVASFTDITQQKQAEDIIHNLAFFDPLTELPNRRLLQDRLNHTLATSARNDRHGAILFLDLDNFKELNDSRGHGIGDLLLIEVAKRLQGCVREDDTVARLGGDEFVIVLNDLNGIVEKAAVQAETIAEKMRDSINQTVDLNGLEHQSSPSIGISIFKGDSVSTDELLKRADTAMYQAKQSGRNAICFFDPETHAAMEARIALEKDLRGAVSNDELKLFFQMQVDNNGSIIGAEALLRWQHPERGMVSPLHFIPLAEETGLILSIGHWVLEAACAQLKAWECEIYTRQLQLAINVSASQIHQVDFVDQVYEVLERTGINPKRLKFELTESMMHENVDETIAKINALNKMGIDFSMDDFGTGHSSLAYLSQLPLNQIKIDQSFVKNIGLKRSDTVIVQTIIGMAKSLGMDVIAEGVETSKQHEFLERSGCFRFQGYLFGKPMPAEEFENALAMSMPELSCVL